MPKAFVALAGRPLLAYAVQTIIGLPGLRSLVIVVPHGYAEPTDWPSGVCALLPAGSQVVVGGAERTGSVRAGLARLDPECDVVLVHDAARALTPLAVFERVVEAVRAGAAGAVPGVPVVDTIKSVDIDGVITGTPDRSSLRAIQTPQGFDREILLAAYASGLHATDDAALVEADGHHVRVVRGDPLAFKVTTVADLAHAERVLATSPPPCPNLC